MAEFALEIKNLIHVYCGQKILDIPHFCLKQGECLVILGPNGAGKSTFLRIASLLEKPTQGELYFAGLRAEPKNELTLRRRLVYLLERSLFFHGNVKDNLLYGLKLRGLSKRQQQQRLEAVSELFYLQSLLNKWPEELSAGEKQRVNLARAFIIYPDLLFLDEPFSNLDQPLKEEIMREFQRARKKRGQTTVVVTHNRDEAMYLADRLAIMIQGEIKQIGQVEEVLASPASLDIASLLGQETLVEGVVEKQENGLLWIKAAHYQLCALGQAQIGEKVKIIFRPEEVIIASSKPQSSIRNWFYGTVIDIKPLDRVSLVTLDCGFPLKAYLTKAAVEELAIELGKKFWAGVKASSLSAQALGFNQINEEKNLSYLNSNLERKNDQL